jgi:hypothetical protein
MLAILAALIVGALLGCTLGMYLGGRDARRSLAEVRQHYEALQRDFERVSSANIKLLGRNAGGRSIGGEEERQRFFDLYDEAKRCLHRALDRYNARAPRPIVILRDGSNFLETLSELPEGSFGARHDDDALRTWVRQVFEIDAWRRAAHAEPSEKTLIVLENGREVVEGAIRQHLK